MPTHEEVKLITRKTALARSTGCQTYKAGGEGNDEIPNILFGGKKEQFI